MSAEYSVGELRTEASKQLEYGSKTAWEMLTAYADLRERIEADERTVPVPNRDEFFNRCSQSFGSDVMDRINELWDAACAYPPAQAAQVDKPPRLGGCCCGEPCTLGMVHRTDGPCFVYEQPADSGRVTQDEVARLIEMCGDVWQSMNAYTDQFDKGSKGVASVEVSAIDLVNWCQVIAMASRGLRGLDTNPHSPDAADSGRVDSEVVAKWFGQIEHELTAKTLSERNGDQCWKFELRAFVRKCQAALAAQPQSAASPVGVPDGWAEHGNDALNHISNALDDMDSNPDQRAVPQLREAMHHIRSMLSAAPPAPDGGECYACNVADGKHAVDCPIGILAALADASKGDSRC